MKRAMRACKRGDDVEIWSGIFEIDFRLARSHTRCVTMTRPTQSFLQIDVYYRNIPMSRKDFKPMLLFFLKGLLVREQLPDQRLRIKVVGRYGDILPHDGHAI